MRYAKPKLSRRTVDAAAWDVFARHQPYYHILSHPNMLSPGPDRQEEFWASGTSDIQSLQTFAGLQLKQGTGVDLGCGLGRLTRAMRQLTTHQIGLDISCEMLRQAREFNQTFSSVEFRQIRDDHWAIETGSCVLVISLYVLQHMSSLELIDCSIREMGRVLVSGGRAVFNVPTVGWPGHFLAWARRSWTNLKGQRNKQRLRALEERLVRGPHGSVVFTEQEIMQDMFQLECRRMKSMPLARLRASTRASGLAIYRMRRGEFGLTLIAAEKR